MGSVTGWRRRKKPRAKRMKWRVWENQSLGADGREWHTEFYSSEGENSG